MADAMYLLNKACREKKIGVKKLFENKLNPISGRLLATPISGRGGGVFRTPP